MKPRNLASVLAAALVAVACGGGNNVASDATTNYSGTVIVPDSLTGSSELVLSGQADAARAIKSEQCPKVPDGYQPAVSAPVELRDDAGAVVESATTDECGFFSVNSVSQISVIEAAPVGYQSVNLNPSTADAVVSALPTGATIEIAALIPQDGNKVSVLIVDSATKKAVIGLPNSAYTVSGDGTDVAVTDVSDQGVILGSTEPFSTAVILDSSGSMTSCAANCLSSDTGPRLNRFQMVSRASHEFVSGKKPIDEVAISYFSTDLFNFKDGDIPVPLFDAAGTAVDFTFSPSGFTDQTGPLHFFSDLYNRESSFYSSTDGDALNAETVQLGIRPQGSYRFSGGTALYNSVVDAVGRVSGRSSQRKIVLALTDGANNRGTETIDTAISTAVAAGTPVYTIGFGLNPDSSAATSLRRVAEETGASTTIVNGTDLVGLFVGLQTAIRFDTTLTLARALVPGEQVTLFVMIAGQPTVSRVVTVPSGSAS
jgi:hypothetical protein